MEPVKEKYYQDLQSLNLNEEVNRALAPVNDIISLEDVKAELKKDMIKCAENVVLGYSIINDLKANTDELMNKKNAEESEEEAAKYDKVIEDFVNTIDHTFNAIEEDANQLLVYRAAYDSIQNK